LEPGVVQLLVRITAVSGHADELIQALRSVRRGVQREDVNTDVHIATDVDDDNVVWFCEEWPTLEACEDHLRSIQFARMLAVVETAAEAPRLECRLISESRGLDYVASVRGAGRSLPTPPRRR
jgi:quinol monooxygenase YgiN